MNTHVHIAALIEKQRNVMAVETALLRQRDGKVFTLICTYFSMSMWIPSRVFLWKFYRLLASSWRGSHTIHFEVENKLFRTYDYQLVSLYISTVSFNTLYEFRLKIQNYYKLYLVFTVQSLLQATVQIEDKHSTHWHSLYKATTKTPTTK